ncbi:MAG TPA: NUDIX domain-containing protein [Candidatus Accumulibacter phosphatis]|nr:MAG: bifunctional nicotinamide mononucleotide adenylyltransferase/ADP-ribose pyrophosphatase [Candidatus Accumulibacter sp. SK-11]HCN67081.1 NUDIX hydrolase [Accumulibacter sp.]HRL77055.1 NUDIX domain-containing protein [Candidatus Accumulibacter phosphatis]HRQ96454.1 NUDIX domain-containing protein [Candidatus Accumulibacter phosphatis]
MSKNLHSSQAFPRPLTTVDVVIFTVIDDQLHVLLVKRPTGDSEPYPGMWALPGGYVDIERDKDLEACALHKLKEKTGVVSPYLEQLGSWGNARRDPRGWTATHVYFAILPYESVELHSGSHATDIDWFQLKDDGVGHELAFDHSTILATAIARLRGKAEYTSLPAYLLPDTFTLSELQHVFSVVLGRPVDKSGFRTRVLSANLVEEADGVRSGYSRPAQLYRLKTPQNPTYFPRTFNPRKD